MSLIWPSEFLTFKNCTWVAKFDSKIVVWAFIYEPSSRLITPLYSPKLYLKLVSRIVISDQSVALNAPAIIP